MRRSVLRRRELRVDTPALIGSGTLQLYKLLLPVCIPFVLYPKISVDMNSAKNNSESPDNSK